ncbi:polyprenyl synthetase family protein [Bartonella henselae]|uniref:polyprenyl synthetase family protein n=1 Tax=Bartonella henselae TaxID=38323 RepID=UPI00094AD840|nr:polyprenyl synthetase family protein [Bartonella henselae]MDM9983378.1 polyprenyl synthetase family protein [Bartonella henselae]MDM9984786.1 polyprenyl synthetase family protein [Bartonella henselae]MDM9986136.1 polyprenyl synthetase family protein [Bartonella henselae]MDM9987657.1 polyprenyl synthetase family protein [Bartonella henselae]MDM9989498.1 polyprenyl synthetase family protein [Bartonella henselae]
MLWIKFIYVHYNTLGVKILRAAIKSDQIKNNPISLQSLVNLTKDDMEHVNQCIFSMAKSDVEMIPEISNHLISSGGKRLRPMLTLASARMFGYQNDGHIKLATAVEFMHTATLLHDDVIDESNLRRGKSTARMIWGNQASILVGDFLLGQAFKMMVDVGSIEALSVLANAAAIIAEGEVMQLSATKNIETSISDYLKIINAKTAALFSAAAEVGPIIAGYGHEERLALREYGTFLGLAFQLIDDALDYGGTAKYLGKNIGDDFREGKITMPVILAYARSNAVEKTFWKQALENGNSNDETFAHAQHLIEKYDSLTDTIEQARSYGKNATHALAAISESPIHNALIETVDFCIARVN